MSDLSHTEILQAPGYVMFWMFINSLLGEGKATFSPKTNKAIILNSEASNYFIMGRDEDAKPYIGIQETMIPWFLEIPWSEIALCPDEKYLYLIAKENDEVTFVLGLKPRLKRMIALIDPKVEKIEKVSVNFKIFKIVKNEIAVSHNNAVKGIKIKWCKSICDILRVEDKVEDSPEQDNLEGFTIIKGRK